ncbi:6002_t:CDS:2 [Cetraspora pellucida]|uniref:6002_t:CDS:1 n=1 Tax=Cetraspora pellucida TaxID=1433469 RepID=A0ACA9P2N9_9GLOM|nr:6002_t:CDS:2 [Cetraspora pellucida]
MTLDPVAITFRLDGLLGSLSSYKNSEKELLSIIKVFEELNKEKKRMEKTARDPKISGGILAKMDIDNILANIQEKINNSGDKKLIEIVLEMEIKGLKFARGLDFNNSEIKDFKIENNTIYFPFTAIAGIGEKVAQKIIAYRREKKKITRVIFSLIPKRPDKIVNTKPTSVPPANKNEEIPPEQPTNNPFSPPPAPNNNYSIKTLARVIKDDLQDTLTNKNHLKNYFLDYQLFEDGEITIFTKKNEKLNEELKENFNRHYQQRKEK